MMDRQDQACIAIAGGGTAGHVLTGLALVDAFRALPEPPRLIFLGTPSGMERQLVPPSGVPLVIIPGFPMAGESAPGRARSLLDLARGALAARTELRRHGVGLVLGLGGYASAGALLAARSLGLRAAIHEANARPGITHRRLGNLAHRVYVSFPSAAQHFAEERVLLTGTPLAPGSALAAADPDGPKRIVVTGASLGSPFLDRAVPPLLGALARGGLELAVLHQTGLGDPGPVRARYLSEGIDAEVVPFVPNLARRFGEAHFAIACAGARTLTEIAAAGLPALFVPLASAAGDHQTENARAFAATTGAWWLSEAEWEPTSIAEQIEAALRSAEVSRLLSKRLDAFVHADAAEAIAEDCARLLARP